MQHNASRAATRQPQAGELLSELLRGHDPFRWAMGSGASRLSSGGAKSFSTGGDSIREPARTLATGYRFSKDTLLVVIEVISIRPISLGVAGARITSTGFQEPACNNFETDCLDVL